MGGSGGSVISPWAWLFTAAPSNGDLGLIAPGLLHPRGDVARAMQHAPNVDMVRGFDVEHDVRDAPDRPRAQARQVQFHRVAR